MFKKYQKIENHYNQKYIKKWIYRFPELETESYIVSEKLDGANVQFYFKPGKKIMIGGSNSWLKEGEKFFGIWDTLKNIDLSYLQKTVEMEYLIDSLRVYCEFLGNGINNRIKYFEEPKFVIHDIEINDKIINHHSWYKTLKNKKIKPEAFDFEDMEMNVLESLKTSGFLFNENYFISSSLKEALETDLWDNTSIFAKKEMKGTVIRPYSFKEKWEDGTFILKKKNPLFDEIPSLKERKNKEPKVLTSEQEEFLKYINENRLTRLFSKEGEISTLREISKYVKLLMVDAICDFKKDYPSVEDSKVFSPGGNKAANIIKEFLKGVKNGE